MASAAQTNVTMRQDTAIGKDCLPGLVRGDRDALARLYDETRSVVYGLALRILNDTADAEEVTLDVYLQAWRSAGQFDAERGSVMSWLVTLTRSRAIDRLRSRASRRRVQAPLPDGLEFPATDPGPEEVAAFAERRRVVRNALATLPPAQRRALELAYFAGMTQTEVAAHLDQPLGTIKTRVRAGMARLRAQLAGLE